MNTARVVIQPVTGDARTAASSTARRPADPVAARRQVLLCRVDRLLVALPIGAVVETMRPLPVQSLPGLPGYVRGVAMIRGAGTPVVDLAALLGGPVDGPGSDPGATPGSSSGRFVTLSLARPGGSPAHRGDERRLLALAVDEVVGVRVLDAAAAGDRPPLLAGVDRGLLTSLGSLDDDLLHVLEAANLVDDDLWAAVDGAAAGPDAGGPA